MFLSELNPLLHELVGQPVAFLGGLTSGLLRIDLSQDPVKSWLDQQLGTDAPGAASVENADRDGSGDRPQSISID